MAVSFNFRRFLALFRPDLYTPFELALRDIAHRRYEDAIAKLDQILADPQLSADDRAAAANKRGVALVELDRRQEARAAFETALASVPKFVPALVNLGNLHLEAGETEQAIRYYERAVLSDEDYALAHHNLGVAYKRLGRTGDSVRELRKAHRLEGRVVRKPRK
ncbi:MAG TPA: tetratricopeptide repeat protein [Candidatus Baltobacteraceae bacterium]|nr:tetratricopeptide repeat protein [Candidatus Baltobacteraceae bacterium]